MNFGFLRSEERSSDSKRSPSKKFGGKLAVSFSGIERIANTLGTELTIVVTFSQQTFSDRKRDNSEVIYNRLIDT